MLMNSLMQKANSSTGSILDPYGLLPVTTTEHLHKAFRLRHQVYCVEKRYEASDERNGMEYDRYDDHSVHTLLVDSHENAIGNVRLILPNYKKLEQSFPIQAICSHRIVQDRQFIFGGAAEVSRFAISKSAFDAGCRAGASLPVLSLGLIRSVIRMSRENGIDELFAIMEPALLRLLARLSIHFYPIGPLIDHHGMRRPCHVNVTRLLQRAEAENPAVWAFITDDGRYSLHSASPLLANCC